MPETLRSLSRAFRLERHWRKIEFRIVPNLLRLSAKLVRALLYVVLRRAGSKNTLEEVGDLIHPENIVMVQEGLLTAWAASMPVRDDDAERPTPAAP